MREREYYLNLKKNLIQNYLNRKNSKKKKTLRKIKFL